MLAFAGGPRTLQQTCTLSFSPYRRERTPFHSGSAAGFSQCKKGNSSRQRFGMRAANGSGPAATNNTRCRDRNQRVAARAGSPGGEELTHEADHLFNLVLHFLHFFAHI